MPRYVTTPWRTPSDLIRIRTQLYGDHDLDERRAAVNEVLAWKERIELPLAIESTILLVEAFLHDDPMINSHLAIRAMYASAISRFVTGFCDTIQDGATKSSMHDMAALLAMPARFVEMRHEATHQGLPSLNRLQQLAHESLTWLWGWYWSKLDDFIVLGKPASSLSVNSSGLAPGWYSDGDGPEEGPSQYQYHGADAGGASKDNVTAAEATAATTEELRVALKTFQSGRRAEIKANSKLAKYQSTAARGIAVTWLRLCKNKSRQLEMAVSLLVDDKAIVPSDKKLGDPMNGAFLFWDVVLRQLVATQPNFLPLFVSRMAARMTGNKDEDGSNQDSGNESFKEAMHSWLLHVLTSKGWAESLPSSLDELLDTVLTVCFVHPTTWGRRLSQNLIYRLDRDQELRITWQPLFETMRTALDGGDEEEDRDDDTTSLHSTRSDTSMVDDTTMVGAHGTTTIPAAQVVDNQPSSLYPRGWAKRRGNWERRPITVGVGC